MTLPQPHRAIYDLELDHASGASGIVSLDGRMVVEWRGGAACDGFTSEQRVVTRTRDDQGVTSMSDVRLSTWESLDGNEFRYDRGEYLDGELAAHEFGVAKRQDGVVVLVPDEGETIELPAKVMFPSAYNAALVKAMRKGSRSLVAILFDGAQSSASDVTAFLGAPKSANNGAVKTSIKHADRGVALSDMQPQLVHMSYFDSDGAHEMKTADAPPNFEMDYQLFPNGVMDQLKLSYGDVVIGGTMKSLEYFPSGGC
tara:strand:+ start:60623 stop:61390 length:768 start_codon:yes stop_codon:yes gene_type:complete